MTVVLTAEQKELARWAACALKEGRYWHGKGGVARTAKGRPVHVDHEDARYFDIHGLLDRVNADFGFPVDRITPIFDAIAEVVCPGRLGQAASQGLVSWNDHQYTSESDVLLVLRTVGAEGAVRTSASEARAASTAAA